MERAPPLRRGHCGKAFPQKLVEKALRLRRAGKRKRGQTKTSWRCIARRIGAFSDATPRRWAHKDMSPRARALRLKNCGHKRLLSCEEEQVAAGWFISRCIRRFPTTTVHARLFFASAFNFQMKPSWLSKFADRHHLSVRRGKRCKWTEVRGLAFKEALNFFATLHLLNKEPHQILALDKTSIYTTVDRLGHWGPKGRYKNIHPPYLIFADFLVVAHRRGRPLTVGRRISSSPHWLPTAGKDLCLSLRTIRDSSLLTLSILEVKWCFCLPQISA
jgi:hypothetical protein